MKRDIKLYIEDILESIQKIEEYTHNYSEEKFLESIEKQDAVSKRIEIIGEAVKNIPASLKSKYPGIPWKDIAGMRDILIHAYFGIDAERLWKVIIKDMPELKEKMLKIIKLYK